MTPAEILQEFACCRAVDAPLRHLIRQTATPARRRAIANLEPDPE